MGIMFILFTKERVKNSLIVKMTQPCRYAAKGLFDCLGIDVFVNSSGILCNGDTLSLSLEAYDRCMNINTRSAFILMQKVLPHLIQTKGNIVNVSSVTGIHSFKNL